jgi:TDG/mug DNA glycosylase family protein
VTGVPDVVGPGVRVLFCGINPGTLSGALGQHFARPGNRFWKLLAAAGFTDRVLAPTEQDLLPGYGVGITNIVRDTTAAAAELTTEQLSAGGRRLEADVARWAPAVVAVLGMQAYRTAFRRPWAGLGPQPEGLGPAAVWLLPNPSGLQARYQLPEMTAMWAELRAAHPARAGLL